MQNINMWCLTYSPLVSSSFCVWSPDVGVCNEVIPEITSLQRNQSCGSWPADTTLMLHQLALLAEPVKLVLIHLRALTGHTLSIGIGLPVTGVGVAGGAAVHSAQQGAQVAHRHLLDEGGPILPEIPPLEYLRQGYRERAFHLVTATWGFSFPLYYF